MKFKQWKKQNGFTLPNNIVARIVGTHPNYLYQLYTLGEVERVKGLFKLAEEKFQFICKR